MLFKRRIAVYCENHTKQKYALWVEYSFNVSKKVVYVVTTGLWKVNTAQGRKKQEA
jgi:hypothetical protein